MKDEWNMGSIKTFRVYISWYIIESQMNESISGAEKKNLACSIFGIGQIF